jgi:hypothetical protein
VCALIVLVGLVCSIGVATAAARAWVRRRDKPETTKAALLLHNGS